MKKIFLFLGLFLLLIPFKVNADNTAVNYIFGTINNDHGAYGYCVDLNQNNQNGDLDTFANSLDQFYMGLVGRGVCDSYKADDTYDNYFFGVYYYFPNTDSGKYYTLLNGHNYYYQFRINFWRKEDAKEVYDSLQEKNLLESADGLDIYKFEYFYENYSIVVSVYFSPTENLNRTHMNLWTTRSFSLNWLKSNISTITYPIHNEIGVNEQSIQADLDKINDNINATGSAINSNIDSMKEKQDETNNLIGGESENTEDSKCGVICKLKGIFTGIIELPGKLVSLLIDALKSLFVPTDEQLYEIINDSKDLAENFGFVGESVDFFLTIFTSLLGMVNANGCIELPEFTIGATSLTPNITFWHAQNVCLNDNLILSSNITTIRTITSIALVALFINFSARKFFSILSKNDNDSNSISYDPRTGEVRE